MIFQLLIVAILVLVVVYLKGVKNEQYWRKRGVVFHQRNKVMGIAWDYITQNRAFFEHFHDIYKKYPNEPAVGIGSVLKPAILLRDVTNIQHITSTEFNAFNHKGFEIIEEDTLANNIFLVNGRKWKLLRQSMSPLFTLSKLKLMYHTIDKSARDIVPYMRSNPKLMKGNALETILSFCSAAMTAAVFGISANSIFESPFLKMLQNVVKPTFWLGLKFVLSINVPILIRVFKIKFFSQIEKFFVGAIKNLLRSRENEPIKRHDFADLCVSIQKNGMLKDEETGLEVEPTDELLAAQAFFFFFAGVEPTATAIFNTLLLLGQHQTIKRLHDEIDEAFDKNEGNMSFDVVSQLEYLDMVLNESMRLYPPVGYVLRECVSDSVLPVGNIKIEKGTTLFIPIFPVHHDEKYYPDPEVFDPERFSRDNKAKLNEKAFLPFGKGNRICIGARYATAQAKAGLVQLLRNFTVKTKVFENEMKYKKDQIQVRLTNVDVEFIERKVKTKKSPQVNTS